MAFGYEEELKAEIARLRDAMDEQSGRAAWNYECLTQCEERVIQRDAEIARLRITDEEREALEAAVGRSRRIGTDYAIIDTAVLTGFLERHKGGEFDR